MKTFFTVFFAILSAAAVILVGLWGKARLDAWELAWRSNEAQAAAIIESDQALNRTSNYMTSPGSLDAALARLQEATINIKRMEDDQVRVAEIEERTVAILEHKPFGLPLTSSERKELATLKEDVRMHPQNARTK